MKNILFTIFLFFVSAQILQSQVVFGTLLNQNEEPLFGATILWEHSEIGTVADEKGQFEIPKQDTSANLVIQYVGYESVLIAVEPFEDTIFIQIDGVTDLMQVEVAANIQDNFISTLNSLNVESITSGEFKKAACCALGDCFETNASIDVVYSDAVTGAREIQMLGLRGLYVQTLMEKRPTMTGLGTALGLEFIPGTWLETIFITKGAGSVQGGYQPIGGQINMELKKPFEDHKFFLNMFLSRAGRIEGNMHLNFKLNKNWSTGFLLHGSSFKKEFDENEDTFLDRPTKEQLNGLYRIFYRSNKWRAQFNIHALKDKRNGGEVLPLILPADPEFFTVRQKNERIELFGKIGFVGFKNENNSLGFVYNTSWHELKNHYGYTEHQGTQRDFYGNLVYTLQPDSSRHQIFVGTNYSYTDHNEFLNDMDFSRLESVPGVFLEYGLKNGTSDFDTTFHHFGLVTGLRVDKHNLFDLLITPRINLKYNIDAETVFRLSAGRGFRTPNVVAENIGVFISSRQLDVQESLKMEEAWNFGANFTKNFFLWGRSATFNLDLYHTRFEQQVVLDLETDRNKILFYNLNGESYANSAVFMTTFEPISRLEVKLAYKFNDVKITYDGDLRQKPLLAKHRGLLTLDYRTRSGNWMFNTALQIVGEQRFPDNSAVPEDQRQHHEGFSPMYPLVNAQVTRKFGNLEMYLGGENLTNYRQENPIIAWEDPKSTYFDASQVYAPLFGARAFIGLRFFLD